MSDKKEEEEVWNTISRKNYLHPPEISIFLCAGWTSLKNFDSHDPFQRNSSARKSVINVVCPKVYPSPIQIPSLAITFDFNYRFGMDKRILTTILDDGLFPPCSAAQFAPPLRWLEGVQKGTTPHFLLLHFWRCDGMFRSRFPSSFPLLQKRGKCS